MADALNNTETASEGLTELQVAEPPALPPKELFEPKYIEKLIAAINDGAKSAQLGALAFTAIGLSC